MIRFVIETFVGYALFVLALGVFLAVVLGPAIAASHLFGSDGALLVIVVWSVPVFLCFLRLMVDWDY